VYADDIFSEFEKVGIYNKKIGKKYFKEILEVGSERDEKKSVEEFLGRKSNSKAFLKILGIK
jgi:thimet oligopeptidase